MPLEPETKWLFANARAAAAFLRAFTTGLTLGGTRELVFERRKTRAWISAQDSCGNTQELSDWFVLPQKLRFCASMDDYVENVEMLKRKMK